MTTALPEVYIDYETRSEVNLPRAGLWAYAKHKSTRVLCVAYAIGDGPVFTWHPGQSTAHPDFVRLKKLFANERQRFNAFNANFERAITECVMARLGVRSPRVDQWNDTQAVASYCALPKSLERCAAVMLKKDIQKDKDGHRLIRLFSIPQKSGAFVEPKDAPVDFKKMLDYCAQDVRVDRALHNALPIKNLPEHEQRIWVVDSVINARGVPINVRMAKGAIECISAAKGYSKEILSKLTKGKITSAGQAKRIKALFAEHGITVPDLKKETVAALLDDEDLPPLVRKILEHRSDTNVTSVAKFKRMLEAANDDGRIRGVHAYCSATTHRWGGRIVQFQNLPRPDVDLDEFDHELIARGDHQSIYMLYGSIMPVLRDALRNVIQASKGRELFVVDKASIEARVLGWLCDDPQYLKAFKEGLDLYKVTASVIFGVPYDKVTSDQRWLGKCCVLGLGYGMGIDTFESTCEKNGRTLPKSLIKKAVNTYRTLYKCIPAYWSECEDAMVAAIQGKPSTIRHGVTFAMRGPHLTITLPSGSQLFYPFAKLERKPDRWGRIKNTIVFMTESNKQWVRASTYGGRIVENIVQSVARDLLANALLKCEDAGLFPIMHVHDEIVCEPYKGQRKLDEMHTIFRTAPSWARNLPLGSAGFVGAFYRKD